MTPATLHSSFLLSTVSLEWASSHWHFVYCLGLVQLFTWWVKPARSSACWSNFRKHRHTSGATWEHLEAPNNTWHTQYTWEHPQRHGNIDKALEKKKKKKNSGKNIRMSENTKKRQKAPGNIRKYMQRKHWGTQEKNINHWETLKSTGKHHKASADTLKTENT